MVDNDEPSAGGDKDPANPSLYDIHPETVEVRIGEGAPTWGTVPSLRIIDGDALARLEAAEIDLPFMEKMSATDQLKLEAQRIEIQSLQNDMDARKRFSGRIYWLVVGWLFSFMSLIAASAAIPGLSISDSVLITLTTSVSASVLGLLAIVARYLFHRGTDSRKQS